jgi:hypothetical protein
MMGDIKGREVFDTGISRIRQEIKSRLVGHGLYGSVTGLDTGSADQPPTGSTIEIVAKGRTTTQSFERAEIEDCALRVRGKVLQGIIAMVDKLAAGDADDVAMSHDRPG